MKLLQKTTDNKAQVELDSTELHIILNALEFYKNHKDCTEQAKEMCSKFDSLIIFNNL